MKIHAALVSLVLLSGLPVRAAAPPSAINYQGVLRNASGAPEAGSFDMVFRFYSLDTGGTPLLTDTHNAGAPSGQVAVTNGLFSVALGTGTLVAGSEPTLDAVFLHNGAVWLEVQVGAETLSPRVKIISSAYALNAGGVDGKDGSELLDTSATPQTKAGNLQIGGALRDSSGDAGTSGQVLTSTGTGSNWVNPSSLSDGDWTISGSNQYSAVSGNVGIGTAGPGEKLVVAGTGGVRARTTNNGSGTADWIAGNFGFTPGAGDRVVAGLLTGRATIGAHNDALNQWAPLVIAPSEKVAIGNLAPVNKLDIAGNVAVGSGYAGASAAPSNGLLVEGNVGIGITDPMARLHVKGSVRVDATSGIGMFVDPSGSVGIGASGPAYQLELATDSAAKPSSNHWTIPSDERLKRNIRPFTDGLEVLDRIRPIRYQYNGLAGMPKDEEAIGVLAQEMLKVAPDTVGTFRGKLDPKDESETALYSFNSHALTYVMVNALQELDARTRGLSSGTLARSRAVDCDPRAAVAPVEPSNSPGISRLNDGAPHSAVPTSASSGSGSSVVMAVSSDVREGDVVVIVPNSGEALHPGNAAADPLVVGIALDDAEEGKAPVALGGIAEVKADATLSPIARGDLLVASAVPGHAMRMTTFSPNTVLAKALEPLASGTGTIRVLVMMQ